MYLREIGKVYLLSAADEKRLARQMEETDHIERIERHWRGERGRPPTGGEVALALLDQLHALRRTLNFVTKELGVKKHPLTEFLVEPKSRQALDGELDQGLADKMAQAFRCEPGQAERALVQLSIVTHILTPDIDYRRASTVINPIHTHIIVSGESFLQRSNPIISPSVGTWLIRPERSFIFFL